MYEEYAVKMMNKAAAICVRSSYDEELLGFVNSYEEFRSNWPGAEITAIDDEDAEFGEITVYC